MAKLNISQAAEAVGRSRPIIYKKIKQGELTAEIGTDGNKLIDTAELIRVFGEIGTQATPSKSVNGLRRNTPDVTEALQQQIKRLEAENERLLEQIKDDRQSTKQTVEDLRNERDQWRKQAQTLLLTQGEKQPEKLTTIWQWLGIRSKTA